MMLNGGRESILCRPDTTATDLGLLLSLRDEQEGRRNQEIFGNGGEFDNYVLHALGQDICATEDGIEMACAIYGAC